MPTEDEMIDQVDDWIMYATLQYPYNLERSGQVKVPRIVNPTNR